MSDTSAPQTVEQLDELLSRPEPPVTESLRQLPGDLIILGAGGKMGPTLARMARRADEASDIRRRIVGVSRFGTPGSREQLEQWGIETIACDLLNEEAVRRLPALENVMFMAGFKFGAQTAPSRTWAVNCYVPAVVGSHFRTSRVVAFSTGNVYPLVPVDGGGSREEDPPQPIGEYAMTALGRERMFEYFSDRYQFPLALLRLNYASELRYGVLVDLARKIHQGEPVDLSMGFVNVIWQGAANAAALQALSLADRPPRTFNLAGPEVLRIRDVCARMAGRLGREPRFGGRENPDALLSDGSRLRALTGPPSVLAEQLIDWTADWVGRGGPLLDKPTHFEARDGRF